MNSFLEFTHANQPTKVYVVKDQVFSFYFSQHHKCVLLLASAGAMLPVKESLDEVAAKMSTSVMQQEITTGQTLPQTST